jgi:alpha-D-xyloside xylohydrolase
MKIQWLLTNYYLSRKLIYNMRTSVLKQITILLALLFPTFCLGQAVKSYEKLNDKVIVTLDKGKIHLSPLTDNTVRVQYAIEVKSQLPELVFTTKADVPGFKVADSKSFLEISTSKMTVVIDKKSGTISYRNNEGTIFLSEKPGSRIFKQSSVQGEPCYIAGQSFNAPSDEYLFGTGQFQDGYLNIKGLTRKLTQVNTQISIPFIMSSKGYGLLWHNYGLTEFNPADNMVDLQVAGTDGKTTTVNVTTTEGTKKETRQEGVFKGTLTLKEAGQYAIMLDVGQNMARKWQVSIDGKDIISFKNHWLPPTTSTLIQLTAGKHDVVVTGEKNDSPSIRYRKVTNETVFRSPVADMLDYVVFAGNADEVISSYRTLTGQVPLMPLWSLGYIHCRERFHSQDELLSTAKEFRKRKLPMDLIVQDWQYWGKHGWNAMKFDEEHYPDPAQMVNDLHNMNMHLMLSVWSKIDNTSELGKAFEKKNYYIPNTQWVDFFNPDAAGFYWTSFTEKLFKPYQIDAWWQDATEPENDDLVGRKINNGTMPGERLRNVYPLYVTKTIYEGLRKDAPDKRVFILTRSGFSGQQRYAAAVWSGDIGNDWETMRRQLTSGLNYSITGMPWWTFDAGGFFRPGNGQYNDTIFHERLLRWLQFAAFSPLQRVHGYETDTEFWRYGEKLEAEASKYLNLRYRLLPYIYSQAADITFNNGTLMRPLIMDFAKDSKALKQNYEYMFGPAFLVAPVLAEGVKNWNVYLPEWQTGWFNFWSGKHFKGGQSVNAEASLSIIPLFVKAGSIVPMGKFTQHTNEKQADTLEIRVYAGTDGKFKLYEDEGTNYNYEKGKYSIITFEWQEKNQTLIIGKRQGSYNGLVEYKVFNIVFVKESNGTGIKIGNTDISVKYNGERVEINRNK